MNTALPHLSFSTEFDKELAGIGESVRQESDDIVIGMFDITLVRLILTPDRGLDSNRDGYLGSSH